jgi:hypothetical protein
MCIEYILIQLEGVMKDSSLSKINSFIIPYHNSINDELLFDCTKEVLLGKGFDISIVDNGRAKGIAVKW